MKNKFKCEGNSGNKMKTRAAAQRAIVLQKRAKVAEMLLRGYSREETAAVLGISESAVRDHRASIRKGLQDTTAWTYAEYVEIHRRRLERIILLAEEGYENSLRPKEITTVERDIEGNVTGSNIREESQSGNPAFLTVMRKANESLRKLLGHDQQPGGDQYNTQINVVNNLKPDTEPLGLLAFARELGVEDLVIEGEAAAMPGNPDGDAGAEAEPGSNGNTGEVRGSDQPGKVADVPSPPSPRPGSNGHSNGRK